MHVDSSAIGTPASTSCLSQMTSQLIGTQGSEGDPDLFNSKFLTCLAGVAVDSEPESDMEVSDSEPEDVQGPPVRRMGSKSKKQEESSSWMSWCNIL
ncbi:uncharacterized protein [Argopecten irradians]|uniref:uncharacterized protein n=1 Tax=Argopecten irradians TaxID=31199 RepID=UPI003710AA0F